jgi:pilus assembly protein CpaB
VTPRTIILIFAALLTAGGTIYFAQSWISRERAELEALRKQPVKQEAETQVLVAKKNLPAGLFLKPEDVEWRPWPEDGVVPSYYLKGEIEKTGLIGAVVRRGIAAGEPISEGKIARPGDQGFLAAVLEPGMRAVTVSINSTAGVAGFVFPGDRVDLLLTTEIQGDGRGKRYATETVLTKLRVLAVDQRVNDIENTPKVSKTVTVEVTPKQAEMIAVADKLGHLSLALRSLARKDQSRDGDDGTQTVKATVANGAADAKDADPSDKQKPDVSVAADSIERQPPERGRTVTLDSEASRLVGPRSDANQVIIIRGAKAEAVKTGGGSGGSGGSSGSGGSGGSAAAPSAPARTDGPQADDTVEGGAAGGAAPIDLIVPYDSGTTGGVSSLGASTTDLLRRGRL